MKLKIFNVVKIGKGEMLIKIVELLILFLILIFVIFLYLYI